MALSKHMQAAYGRSALETEVLVATPHKLVLMLLDGALQAIRRAKIAMEAGQVADKGMLIGKAISIVDEGLRLALDHEKGGDIAANLDQLYEYCTRQLFQANINNDPALLDQVCALLGEIRDAWVQIGVPANVQGGVPGEVGKVYGAA